MPSALLARVDLDLLYPPFLLKLLDVLAECKDQGAHYYATLGFRTPLEQQKLFAQGRTQPGAKVTNAPGYESVHNYGAAIDLVRDADLAKAGLQPYWAKDGYAVLAAVGAKHGLQVGVPGLADWGHVQIPLTKVTKRRELECLLELKPLVRDAADTKTGLAAAWRKLDEWGFAS